jgi:hypothetical protein
VTVLLLQVGSGAGSIGLWTGSSFFLPISVWVLSFSLRWILFCFVSFLGIFVFICLRFFAFGFVSPRVLPPPPIARCGSFTCSHHIVLPSSPSSVVPSRLAFEPPPSYFCFCFCFHVLDLYLFSCFLFMQLSQSPPRLFRRPPSTAGPFFATPPR